MNRPGTAREALIAEAIGDLARLLDRAEALQPAMLESCQALVDAHVQLADQLAAFEAHVAALTEKAKVQAVKHILARADEAARRSVDTQTRAMAEAAQTLFKAEIGPAAAARDAAAAPGAARGPSVGAVADACGDRGGGVHCRLRAGCIRVGTVSADDRSFPDGYRAGRRQRPAASFRPSTCAFPPPASTARGSD